MVSFGTVSGNVSDSGILATVFPKLEQWTRFPIVPRRGCDHRIRYRRDETLVRSTTTAIALPLFISGSTFSQPNTQSNVGN
jgi:hypothetical protein